MKKILLICFLAAAVLPLWSEQHDAVDYFRKGRRAELSGDYYTAIEMYKSSLELNEDYLEPVAGLAHSYYGLGEYEEAINYAETAEKFDHRNTDILNLKGRIYLGLEMWEKAAEMFNRVLGIEENNVDADFGLAELDIASGRITNASKRYEEALQVSPESRKALLALVLINDNEGRSRAAEVYLRQALQYYSDNAYVRYTAARHFYRTGNLDEALYHLKTALFLQPDFLDASILLCRIYITEEKYEQTAAEIEKNLFRHEDEVILWYMLGLSYEKLGIFGKAVTAYARALSIRPDEDLSRIALENIVIRQFDMGSPVREVYASYHLDLGKKYEERNMLEKAVYEYRRALVINPYSIDGRLSYAGVYKRMNNIERYLLILSGIVEEGYDDVDVLDELEIRRSMQHQTISEKWDIDQYLLDKEINRISIFYSGSDTSHIYGEDVISDYIEYLFMGYENVDIAESSGTENYAEAFRKARESGADYFIMYRFKETERVVSVAADIYLSSTGNILSTVSTIKTGNQMLPEACRGSVSEIMSLLPTSGRVVKRRFDEALINLGYSDGINTGDRLEIVRKGAVERAKDGFGFYYEPEAVLGYIDITSADELVSEGEITVNGFFDMINPGDLTLSAGEEGEEDSSDSEVPESAAAEQLFISGDLFKSIVRIK